MDNSKYLEIFGHYLDHFKLLSMDLKDPNKSKAQVFSTLLMGCLLAYTAKDDMEKELASIFKDLNDIYSCTTLSQFNTLRDSACYKFDDLLNKSLAFTVINSSDYSKFNSDN